MFKDNKDFYPTPQHLIQKMISGIDFKQVRTFLEPSAGSGNILEALKQEEKFRSNNYHKETFDIDCIEADSNLQSILKGKGFRVVHNDFLTYDTMKEYDCIIMNPPFSNGSTHLMKALEMQERNGAGVVCILNAETLHNPCTAERKALSQKLQDNNASIEYIADTFTDAERKTGVEIALIKVQMAAIERTSFILDGLHKAKKYSESYVNYEDTQLVENDFLRGYVKQFNMEVDAGIKLIREFRSMQPFIMSSFTKDKETGETIQSGSCVLSLDLSNNYDKYTNKLSINSFIREVRRKYWEALFHNDKFTGQLTDNLQREFYNRVDELQEYDFTMFNILSLREEMQRKTVKGIEDTIVGLFEELSNKYHYYDEMSKNIHLYNGWKTNKAYIINKKVIIPLSGFRDLGFSWGGFRPSNYKVVGKLQDIEKCFNYLDGGLTDAVDLKESLEFAEENEETKNIALKYFDVTFYKKGTCHIVFTNRELLKKFNIFGSQHKGWLPPCYGKKTYRDMNAEEKAVVNEFEGEKEYQKVVNNAKYYLFDAGSTLPLLTSA